MESSGIKIERLKTAFCSRCLNTYGSGSCRANPCYDTLTDAVLALQEQGEIVRCKDCRYWIQMKDILDCTDAVKICHLAYWKVGGNGYCVYGKRKYEKNQATDIRGKLL